MSQGRPYAVTGGGIPEIFPGTLAGLGAAFVRAQELSAACSPREVRKGRQVIRRYENGTWVSRGGSGERGIAG
jgi:hypothetical protein